MLHLKSLLLVYFAVLLQSCVSSSAFLNIRELQVCPDYPDMTIKGNISVKEINGTAQAISGYFNSPVPIGDNMKGVANIYAKVAGQWVQIIKITERDPCKMGKKFLGQNWLELQRRCGLPIGICPIPKGRYYFDNYFLDLNRMNLRLPNGQLKGKMLFYDYETDVVMFCYQYRFDIKNL